MSTGRHSSDEDWTFDDLRSDDARDLCRQVVASRGTSWLTAEETRRVLNDFGLPLLPTVLARTADDAAGLAAVFGYPVVAKLQARSLLHKGLERAGITTHTSEFPLQEANEVLARLRDGRITGAAVLVP